MKLSLTATLCATSLLSCGFLKADTVTASLFSPLPPTGGSAVVVNLPGVSAPSQSTVTGSGYSVSFSGVGGSEGVVQGSAGGSYAAPVAGVSGTTPLYLSGGFGSALTSNLTTSGSYLSTGLGTITITFNSPETSLALLWGSIDVGNSLTLNDAAGYNVTGTQVQAAAAGFVSNGFQGPGGSAYIVVNTTTPFTTVTLTSSVVSFESAGIAAANSPFVTSVTPEPSSITLFGTGALLACAFLCRSRFRLMTAGL